MFNPSLPAPPSLQVRVLRSSGETPEIISLSFTSVSTIPSPSRTTHLTTDSFYY